MVSQCADTKFMWMLMTSCTRNSCTVPDLTFVPSPLKLVVSLSCMYVRFIWFACSLDLSVQEFRVFALGLVDCKLVIVDS